MNIIISKISTLLLILFVFTSSNGFSQNTNNRIPFTALPYYEYDPLTISIGQYQKELLTDNVAELESLESKIQNDINNTNIETLYILSVRLYDLGRKDKAFYWFMTAQSRARIFSNMLDKEKMGGIGSEAFELKQLFLSFNQLVGEYMNGYGFNDIEKGLAVYEKVKEEVKNIQSYKDVYKNIHFLDDANLEAEKTKKENDLAEGIDFIKNNKKKIKKLRAENGIEGKY